MTQLKRHFLTTRLFAALSAMAALCTVSGQEIIPREDLAKVVPRVLERVTPLKDLPLKVDADAATATGMKIKSYGAVIIADKGLTREALAKVGKGIFPAGQLWLQGLAPSVANVTISRDQQRFVTVPVKEEDRALPMLLLGIRKTGKAGLELVVYGKAKEPLLAVPLKTAGGAQDLPLEINMRRGDTSFGEIEINILGLHRAILPVGEQE